MTVIRILMLAPLLAVTCSAPPLTNSHSGKPSTGGVASGGGSACFCDIEEWVSGAPRVDLACFCEHVGCPTSSAALGKPSLAKAWTLKCDGRTSYASSLELAGETSYTFDDRTDTLIGVAYSLDVNVLCEQNEMLAGEPLRGGNSCGASWCLKSWGPNQVADDGECLDPSAVVDPRYSEQGGNGGLGGSGASPAGGGPGENGGAFE